MKLLLLLLPLTLLPTLLRLELGLAAETTEIAPAAPATVESLVPSKPAELKKESAPVQKPPCVNVSGRIPARHALLFM
ncbi:MAG: hypothetical protein ABIV50_10795 [Opitutus sp.]